MCAYIMGSHIVYTNKTKNESPFDKSSRSSRFVHKVS